MSDGYLKKKLIPKLFQRLVFGSTFVASLWFLRSFLILVWSDIEEKCSDPSICESLDGAFFFFFIFIVVTSFVAASVSLWFVKRIAANR